MGKMGKKKREETKDQKKGMEGLQFNKGSKSKFKRSFFGVEDDPATSAILFLACVFCAPSSTKERMMWIV
ncbi:hypothetical protein QJS10_CPA06g01337 [Acorus calamus]|uniref:Uncharacterized protein n=1 Tax=Acorus calamus TaxID=4465 RepID=A0AAV9ELD6_ACOCL|nr:hypothetical protein QJS10_CPA06g01337 [Acorus calamus]